MRKHLTVRFCTCGTFVTGKSYEQQVGRKMALSFEGIIGKCTQRLKANKMNDGNLKRQSLQYWTFVKCINPISTSLTSVVLILEVSPLCGTARSHTIHNTQHNNNKWGPVALLVLFWQFDAVAHLQTKLLLFGVPIFFPNCSFIWDFMDPVLSCVHLHAPCSLTFSHRLTHKAHIPTSKGFIFMFIKLHFLFWVGALFFPT